MENLGCKCFVELADFDVVGYIYRLREPSKLVTITTSSSEHRI
jgi:hypothetical protein